MCLDPQHPAFLIGIDAAQQASTAWMQRNHQLQSGRHEMETSLASLAVSDLKIPFFSPFRCFFMADCLNTCQSFNVSFA